MGLCVLFVDCIAGQHTYKTLCKATLVEPQILMQSWSAPYSEKALEALVITAIADAK